MIEGRRTQCVIGMFSCLLMGLIFDFIVLKLAATAGAIILHIMEKRFARLSKEVDKVVPCVYTHNN